MARTAQGAWPGEGVERLVDLLVPAVADACAVDVIDPTGYPERFAGRIDGSAEDSAWLAALRPRADVPRSATRAALGDATPHVSELTLDLIERDHDQRRRRGADGRDRHPLVGRRPAVREPADLGLLHFGHAAGARAADRARRGVPGRDRRARRRRRSPTGS